MKLIEPVNQIRPGKQMITAAVISIAVGVMSLSTGRADNPLPVAYYNVNIAAASNGGRIVSFTSQLDDKNWKADNLIDGMVWDQGDPKSTDGWASAKFTEGGKNFPQEIVIGFKGDKPRLIGKVILDPTTPEGDALGRWAKDVELFAATDNPDNPMSYTYLGTCRLINKAKPQVFEFLPKEAKYLKLRIRSNFGSNRHVSLGEVEVYEAIPQVSQLDQLIARLEQLLNDLKRYREENQK